MAKKEKMFATMIENKNFYSVETYGPKWVTVSLIRYAPGYRRTWYDHVIGKKVRYSREGFERRFKLKRVLNV